MGFITVKISFMLLSGFVAVAHSSCDVQTTVDCSSINYQHNTCVVSGTGAYTDVWVVQKYSKSACIKGTSYGFMGGYVWVAKGCRAKFGICSCTKYRLVDCDSNDYKYAKCAVPGASYVIHVNVASRRSKSSCTENYSYGITGNSIWVAHGCRARFHVCYH